MPAPSPPPPGLPSRTNSLPAALKPVLAVVAGIAAFSAMDAVMKAASLMVGVPTALLLRNLFATLLTLPLWLSAGRPVPTARVLRVHALRAAITAAMTVLFFYGLVRIPIAEGIAISFLAPIAALFLASATLGERIRPATIVASLLGLVGVGIIAAGRIGAGSYTDETIAGSLAIVASAILYAINLVMQRHQALLAGPVEIAFFQNLCLALIFLAFAPTYFIAPSLAEMGVALGGGLLATIALLLLSWGYARAEAQVLLPIEYTGFLWAALLGWLFFAERVEPETIVGAALIVLGCWIASRPRSATSPRSASSPRSEPTSESRH